MYKNYILLILALETLMKSINWPVTHFLLTSTLTYQIKEGLFWARQRNMMLIPDLKAATAGHM